MSSRFTPGHHFKELDSLRGLAAITMVFANYSNLFLIQSGPYVGAGRFVESLTHTAFFALVAGHEAVILFFVLSGFVLSLQFLKFQPVNYGSFAIKRVFRIWVPCMASLIAALACGVFLYTGHIHDLSNWFNTPWSEGVTATGAAGHLLFLGTFKSDRYNPVLWPLVHGLRISLLFPLIAAFVIRRKWQVNAALAIAIFLFGTVASVYVVRWGMRPDFSLTLAYIGMFILGFLLAQNINAIDRWYAGRSSLTRLGFAVSGFSLYAFSHLLTGRLAYFKDLPVAAGAGMMIVTGICSFRTSAFLKTRIVRFFGDISYSLYLYHAIVLLALTHAFYRIMPISLILTLALATTVLVSRLAYQYVELPAIRYGKIYAAWWQTRRSSNAYEPILKVFSPGGRA
jgi:peptidoglycan/LPS O-acetylase OafA/YrhL